MINEKDSEGLDEIGHVQGGLAVDKMGKVWISTSL